ncbi:porin family protein [bacterium]|nr:porin family protein [bacterium]
MKNMFTLLFLAVLFFSNTASSADYFDTTTNRAHVSLYGGWSKVSEDYGFGGNKGHFGVDAMFYFSQHWFLNIDLNDVDMGESANTSLTQSSLHIGAGYRYQNLRMWAGLGVTTQAKDIASPSFYYVDPAPNTTSIVTVNDQFFSWSLAAAYDFVLIEASDNFPWHFAIGPQLHLSDTFENNGFAPVFSAGISLSLL